MMSNLRPGTETVSLLVSGYNEEQHAEWGLVNNYRVQYFYRSPVKVSASREP